MHLSAGTVVAIVAIVTLALAAAAVVGGQFRISRSQQILANYRETAQSWQAKSAAQQGEIDELRVISNEKDDRITELEKQVTELRGHLNALQEMMIGSSALETIRQDIQAAQDKILTAISKGT